MNKRKLVSYSKYGYIFAIPFIVAFAIFTLYPIIFTLIIGFTNHEGIVPPKLKLLKDPLENFKYLFKKRGSGKMSYFLLSLITTARLWVINFIPQLTLGLLLSAWFTDNRVKVKGQGFFKVVFYLPNIITAATVAIMFRALFGFPVGPINDLLKSLHLIKNPIEFLNKKATTRAIVEFVQCWQWYGSTMITLIAAVIGINPEIFEAAEIDGANRIQKFFRITLPSVRPIMLFTLVTSMIGGLSMFDIPYLLASGGPDNATQTIALFIYNNAFTQPYKYNRAAAASICLFIIIVILSVGLFYIMRDKDAAKMEKLRKQALKKGRV
ncbi:MAG: sugar ABC transporter permease [Clostridiales bacterium]|nr:sugar ABC transporter permease [Clostridiales bacterium]MBR6255236.1 sugar ABC transporter permease [Clostridiales bacterium]MCR5058297.1 sugar ABC transporter permease [Clostridiales bacterium]